MSHRRCLQRRAAEPSGLVSKPAGLPAGERPIRGPDPDDDCTYSGGGGESMAVVACGRRVPGLRGVSTEDRPSDTRRSAPTGDLNLRNALRHGISEFSRTQHRNPGVLRRLLRRKLYVSERTTLLGIPLNRGSPRFSGANSLSTYPMKFLNLLIGGSQFREPTITP